MSKLLKWDINQSNINSSVSSNQTCAKLHITLNEVIIPESYLQECKQVIKTFKEIIIDLAHSNEKYIPNQKLFLNELLDGMSISILDMSRVNVVDFLELSNVEINTLILPLPIFLKSFGNKQIEKLSSKELSVRKKKIDEIKNKKSVFTDSQNERITDFYPTETYVVNITAKTNNVKIPEFNLSLARDYVYLNIIINFNNPIINLSSKELYERSPYLIYSVGNLLERVESREERIELWNQAIITNEEDEEIIF